MGPPLFKTLRSPLGPVGTYWGLVGPIGAYWGRWGSRGLLLHQPYDTSSVLLLLENSADVNLDAGLVGEDTERHLPGDLFMEVSKNGGPLNRPENDM